ncbi:cytochrome c [Paraburkholderia sp. MMS20-SJTR3]|uniref:Cytochrome c n=1 Tax=Paraburkholderia sejongensis TaxID=2886946 RepID=A0ABS8JSK9_9BURK|nr:cytochrome c [Paraburkholderia sp. MMS20-SJTR3]MCC8392890.1 cytochrome c [Paraburkholderia sp. MMS20-SJTR3]
MDRKKTLIAVVTTLAVAASALFAAGHAGSVDAQTAAAPRPAAPKPGDDAVARGMYLARLGDCIACHTAEGGKPFAGGLPLQTPFGKLISSNITPDKETGIGEWTDEEFIRAVRQGRGRHGEFLYPAMPYTAYVRIKDQDIRDIKAYLDTVPAVHNPVVSNQLPFPFNIRWLIFGWNLLFFDNTPFRHDDTQSVEWNRGAYLVQGLGHCGACHTAKNFLGGDRAPLQGGLLQGWFAPEITSNTYTGLGNWTPEEIVQYLQTGGNARSVASGPMAEAVTNSLQYATTQDLHGMAVYLKSFPGSDNRPPAPLDASNPVMAAGHELFIANCIACHRSSGTGVSGMVSSLSSNSGIQAPVTTNLLRTILVGSRGAVTHSNPTGAAMPNFSWKLSDAEVAAVGTYVRNSMGNAAAAVSADDVKRARESLGAQAPLGTRQSAAR